MKIRSIGLDLHRDRIYVTVLDLLASTTEQYEISAKEKDFEAFLATLRPDDQVALEATRGCYYYVDRLLTRVASVSVANPSKMRFFNQGTSKNDRTDSFSLAFLLSIGILPTIYIPDQETRQDREVLHHRVNLVQDQTRIKNRVRAQLAEHGMSWEGSDIHDACAQRFLVKLRCRLPWASGEILSSQLEQIDLLSERIKQMEKLILVRAQRWLEVKLLMTIRGVDVFTAFTILATIGQINRFPTADSLSNFAGLVPTEYSSAGKTRRGKITKAGSKMLRWALTEAVQSLCRVDGHYRNLCKRLERKKKGKGIAATACARKLLKAIWCMLTRNEPFHHAEPELVERKAQRREQRLRVALPFVEARKKRHREVMVKQLGLLQELARRGAVLPVPDQLRAALARRPLPAAAAAS